MVSKPPKKSGPRGSRSDVESVRRNAAEAGRELAGEQTESISELAKALGEISDGEALAHVDSRVAFLERQVERLTARRDEADRGINSELAVMRARIEDALEAVGATAEQQREALAALEKRLGSVVTDAERGSADIAEALRREIVGKVQETASKLEKLDARIRGETKAFEEGFDERSRTFSQSLNDAKDNFETRVASSEEATTERVDESISRADERFAEALARTDEAIRAAKSELDLLVTETAERSGEALTTISDLASEIEKKARERESILGRRLDQRAAEIDQQMKEQSDRLDATVSGLRDSVSAQLSEHKEALETSLEERLTAARSAVEGRLASEKQDFEARLASDWKTVEERLIAERREAEGRTSELGAEVRMQAQRLRETLDAKSVELAGAIDLARRDLLARIQASEEKAAGTAIRLQSLLDQQHREMVSDEQEWSGMLKEVGEDLTELRVRVDDLAGRVASSEARRATERGSSQAGVESITARIGAVEQKMREVVEEMVAKQGMRLEMLASKVSSLGESEVAAEEQFGAVDYLKRRMGEMAERVDEIVTKVNAIGRYVTKPGVMRTAGQGAAPPSSGPSGLDDRLAAIEKAVARLATLTKPSIPREFAERVAGLEESIRKLEAPGEPDHAVAEIAQRLSSLERAIADIANSLSSRPAAPARQADLTANVAQQPKVTPTTILPSKKRRW